MRFPGDDFHAVCLMGKLHETGSFCVHEREEWTTALLLLPVSSSCWPSTVAASSRRPCEP